MVLHLGLGLAAIVLIGGYIFWFLKTRGLISFLWLAGWILGLIGVGGVIFEYSAAVSVLLVIASLVALIGAAVLEYLKRLAEKSD